MNKLAYYTGYMEKEAFTDQINDEAKNRWNAAADMGQDVISTAIPVSRLADPFLHYKHLKGTDKSGYNGAISGAKKGWGLGKTIGTVGGAAAGGLAGGYAGNSLSNMLGLGTKAKLATILGMGGTGALAGGLTGRYAGGAAGALGGAGIGGTVGSIKGAWNNNPLRG